MHPSKYGSSLNLLKYREISTTRTLPGHTFELLRLILLYIFLMLVISRLVCRYALAGCQNALLSQLRNIIIWAYATFKKSCYYRYLPRSLSTFYKLPIDQQKRSKWKHCNTNKRSYHLFGSFIGKVISSLNLAIFQHVPHLRLTSSEIVIKMLNI